MYFNVNLGRKRVTSYYKGKKKMRSEALKRAQQKQNSYRIQFSVNYRLTDIQEGQRLKAYLEASGRSANSYLKELIKKDLDSKGV